VRKKECITQIGLHVDMHECVTAAWCWKYLVRFRKKRIQSSNLTRSLCPHGTWQQDKAKKF